MTSSLLRNVRSRATLGRLALVAACAALLAGLAGCAVRSDSAAVPPPAAVASPLASPAVGPASPAAASHATPSASPPPAPAPTPYTSAAREVHRQAKITACTIAEALTTYEAGTTPARLATRATEDAERRPALAKAVRPLHHAGWWSRGSVVYPQMGGLRGDRASVMVVVRQEAGKGAQPQLVETRTLDIRLVRVVGSWTFDRLASAGGEAVPRPARLPAAARAVLDDDRIALPDSARWDIYRGTVSTSLLRLMADLADQSSYDVAVLRIGHPRHVFGTTRLSQHTAGRAFDIYRVGRHLVVDDRREGSRSQRLARWLAARAELSQLGSPWALDGGVAPSFTDAVHQDHLHVAIR